MDNLNPSKKEDIIKLVYLIALQPEQLDIVIPNYVKTALSGSQKKVAPEQLITVVKKRAQNPEVIDSVIPSFDKLFSHEEIQALIRFYSSEIMKKLSTKGRNILDPLYAGFMKLIREELAS